MATEIVVPDLGEGIDSGDVLEVFVSEGEVIEKDHGIVELETDKATVTVPATVGGKVTRIAVEEGGAVAVGAVLVEIEPAAGKAAAPAPAEPAPAAAPEPPAPAPSPVAGTPEPVAPAPTPEPPAPVAATPPPVAPAAAPPAAPTPAHVPAAVAPAPAPAANVDAGSVAAGPAFG